MLGIVLLLSSACSQHAFVDTFMMSAYRPPEPTPLSNATSERWLAGDFHVHVAPPDADWDVSRGLEETIALAHDEGLDFVVLTPHVPARFFVDPYAVAWVVATQRALREEIARVDAQGIILVPGFEYTDHRYGHVGMAFANLDDVLRDVDAETLGAHPEAFVEAWVAHGGTLIVNHPLVTPVDAPLAIARADLSWRAWTSEAPVPIEMSRIDELATGWEAYNLTATHLRDRWLLHDDERSILATMSRLDREITRRRQRMTPVGGSDSHSSHLRATTFVRASERSFEGVLEGLNRGRVCVRSPEACALRVRAEHGDWRGIGDEIEGASSIEIDAPEGATVFVAGQRVQARTFDVRTDRCVAVRAVLGESSSAPIYVNCRIPSS